MPKGPRGEKRLVGLHWRPERHFRTWFFGGVVATILVEGLVFPLHLPWWQLAASIAPSLWITMAALQSWRLHAQRT
jgi:hypothetical protein